MEEEQKIEIKDEYPEVISPWYLLDLIKPIVREEFIATFRYDRTGIRMKFPNGQKFHLSIKEIK